MRITNYYQPWIQPFLSRKKSSVPCGVGRQYYHSFEDGLWNVLRFRSVPQGAVILLPDFYCSDVVKNIRNHGYVPHAYPVDKNFQTETRKFLGLVRRTKPAAVIIFHAAGIQSRILTDPNWIRVRNSKHILVIEDCVHRLINPNKVRIFNRDHYMLDSLRKVSPLPGSCIYGHADSMPQSDNQPIVNLYYMHSLLWYALFRFVFETGMIVANSGLVRFAHEVILKHHDNIIGDDPAGIRGFSWPLYMLDRFDFRKISALKSKQVTLYKSLLSGQKIPSAYSVRIPRRDYGKLHAYPLALTKKPVPDFIRFLHKNGIVVWEKFSDSKWSTRRSVIYLPLGFHITEDDIRYICGRIAAWHMTPVQTA